MFIKDPLHIKKSNNNEEKISNDMVWQHYFPMLMTHYNNFEPLYLCETDL